MDKLQNNILDICHNYYDYLLSLENVLGVCIGNKVINRTNTFEPCLNVLVKNKVDKIYIPQNNIVPNNYMGIKTDVIETGGLKSFMYEEVIGKFRPLISGCQIAVKKANDTYSIGTLGGIIYKTINNQKEYYLLSNNHVLNIYGEIPIGSPIIQGNFFNGISDKDVVANLSSFIPILFSEKFFKFLNQVDAAIGKLINTSLISKKVFRIGAIDGINNANLNEPVKKVGTSTGLTEGSVTGIGATIKLEYNSIKHTLFKDQIILNLQAAPGDSGSLILNDSDEAIGLLIGGNVDKHFCYANDINIVLHKFHANLYTDLDS